MSKRSRFFWRLFKWLFATGLAAATAGAVLAGGLYLYLAPRLPEVDQLKDVQMQQPLRVYSRDDQLLAVYGQKRRQPLPIDEIPESLRNAFIAAEDNRFYEHPGVDWMGIVRAAWNLVLTGHKGQGGSTITMQVARNFFLTRHKTYIRKINEIILALRIDRELTKDQVLDLYLNKIYLGQGAYGVEAAAQTYYGKSVDELTIAQRAMIAGLPKAPSSLNPIADPQRARGRRDYVLQRMYDNDMISKALLQRGLGAPITASLHHAPIAVPAPYVGEMVRQEAVRRFGDDAYTGGYRIFTSVDAARQRAANRALHTALLAYTRRHGYRGPLASLDPNRMPQPAALKGAAAGTGDAAATDGSVAGGESAADAPLDAQGLDAALARHDRVGPLIPAVVLAVDKQSATIYRARTGLGTIPWSGLKWAAPHLASGATGAAPKTAGDVLSVGDVIYVTAGKDGPQLAQLPRVQGALVALDPHSGGIRALIGGFSFSRSHFNRVTQARRQPGSNFKPFVYSAAVNHGFTAATLINDAPVVFDDPALEDTWRPENYSGRIFGPTRLREGLVHSRNLVSIRVLLAIGVPYAIDYVQRFGFSADHLPHNLTLALGSASLSPLQIARGYSVFANMGFLIHPYLITRIATDAGDVLYRANPATVCPEPCAARPDDADSNGSGADNSNDSIRVEKLDGDSNDQAETASTGQADDDRLAVDDTLLQGVGAPALGANGARRFAPRVIPKRNAYIVRSMMRDIARRGTGRGTRVLGRDDIAAKTGTTDDQVDAWFSGYNSSIEATAWVGYDQNKSLGPRETGARAAEPMWIDFMREALPHTPEQWPPLPDGMVTVRINRKTGKAAGPASKNAMFEIFRRENAPQPPPPGTNDHGGNGGSGGSGGHLF